MAYDHAQAYAPTIDGEIKWRGSMWYATHPDGRKIKFPFKGVCPLDALTEPTGLPRPNHERLTPAVRAEFDAMFDRDDVIRINY